MSTGRIVLLNGTPACGKTALSVELQKLLRKDYGQFWLTLHIDEFMLSSMKAFRGRGNGFWHEDCSDGTIALAFDDRARPLADAVVYSATACARAGLDVIADALVFDAGAARLWDEQLRGLWHLRVGLVCPIEVLKERAVVRERSGGLPAELSIGLSRHYFDIVHQHVQYDLEIDTSTTSPESAARQVAMRLSAAGSGTDEQQPD